MQECLFCKIINGEIETKKFYEDEDYMVFEDVNPKAKYHMLIVPKKHIECFHEIQNEEEKEYTRGLLDVSWKMIEQENLEGCQLQINSGSDHGQEIPHLHLHLLSNS